MRLPRKDEAGRGDMLGAEEVEIAGVDTQLVAATVARAGKEAMLARVRRIVKRSDDRRRPARSAARRCWTTCWR